MVVNGIEERKFEIGINETVEINITIPDEVNQTIPENETSDVTVPINKTKIVFELDIIVT